MSYPVDPTTGVPLTTIAPILRGDDEDYEDPQTKKNVLPIHGNSATYNINNLLYNNILENPYFHALYQLRTYHEVIDEIRRSVKHVEPWQTGTARYPSSAFCLMVKFMLMKLTVKQMNGLLSTDDNSFVRAIGFLYLRYTCSPADLWKWFEPYLEDEEAFQPASDKTITMSVGNFCIQLLTEMQYFGTTLPRIPVPIERKIKVLLLLLEEKNKRRKANLRHVETGRIQPGAKVRAIYGDADNEPAWYEAVVDSRDEGQELKYWVTFPEYGNSEVVDLGDIEVPEQPKNGKGSEHRDRDDGENRRYASRSRSRSSYRRERNRSRSRDSRRRGDKDGSRDGYDRRRDDSRSRSPHRGRSGGQDRSATGADTLLQKVLQSERAASAAVGRNYGQRPASYKGSLSLKLDRYTARKRSPSGDRGGKSFRRRSRSRSPPCNQSSSNHSASVSKALTSDVSAEQQNRLKLLKERYGDASAASK